MEPLRPWIASLDRDDGRADVGGIGFRDAERRSPRMRVREFITPDVDLTGARIRRVKSMGG